MAKFYGKVGFITEVENTSGIWSPVVSERIYRGDVLRNSRRLQTTDQINDEIVVSTEISIVTDNFAIENFHNIRYVVFMNVMWKVTNVQYQRPRLILSLGGVYSGQTPIVTDNA